MHSNFVIPDLDNYYAQLFIGAGDSDSIAEPWRVWRKPSGISGLFILCIGAGGGGGSGFSRPAGSPGGGGGGGGSGAIARMTVAADLIPDVLHIQAHGAYWGTGLRTYISTKAGSRLAADLLLTSGAGNAGAGGNGSGSAQGGTGSAGAIAGANDATWANVGITTFNVGIAGDLGGLHTGSSGGSDGWRFIGGGGGGGGSTGTDFGGGSRGGLIPLYSTANGGNPTFSGGHGSFSLSPFYTQGGAGGGSNNSATGGYGGNAGPGCGGGGGGAGDTGGAGGLGGPGLVFIQCW